MRFLIGVLTGGALTWAASVMLADYVPSPGPAIRWLGAQLEIPDTVIEREPAQLVTAHTDEDAPTEPPPAQTKYAPEREAAPSPPTPEIAETPAETAVVDEPAVVLAPQTSGWESAWVPFETERAALGFAHVLTREIKHPFEVRREARHRYRVTFAYVDDAERERVLAALQSVTGSKS
jgi:hypothetical protein